MKVITKILTALIVLGAIAAVGFHIWFTMGIISTNRPKTIKLDWVNQYKTVIKKDFACITDVNIYYQQGRVHFDFSTNVETSLDDCKRITKATKDFIEKETASKPLMDSGYDQLNIRLEF